MTPDTRLLNINCRITNLRTRWWWLRPVARQLHAIQLELLAVIPETRKMRRALDEITDDAREQAQIAEREASGLVCESPWALAELDRVVGDFARGRRG